MGFQRLIFCHDRFLGGGGNNSLLYFTPSTFHTLNHDISLPNHNKEEYLKCRICIYIQSAVNVFYNPVFLYNIWDINDGIHIQLNRGTTYSKHIYESKSYRPVCYNDKFITNILALWNLFLVFTSYIQFNTIKTTYKKSYKKSYNNIEWVATF